jgi:hypothetical protein
MAATARNQLLTVRLNFSSIGDASLSVKFLGESDEKSFGSADIAEPIRILIPDDFSYELRASPAKPGKRLVDVIHGKHDAEVAQGVYRGVAVVRDDRRREEAGQLETTVPVRRAHHRDLDALIGESGDTAGPLSFDQGPPFKLKTEVSKEIYRLPQVIDDDSHVIHPFERHASNLHKVARMQQGMLLRRQIERRGVCQERTIDVPLPTDLCRASLLDALHHDAHNNFVAKFVLAIAHILFLSFGGG